jgi:signal transduction histidine kinase
MIAHQWRQPLNTLAIINQTLVLKHRRGKIDDNIIEDFKKDSNNQIKQMSATIDDFRNFFKPDKELKKLCISDVLKTTLEVASPMLVSSNIDIKMDIQKDIFIEAYQNEFGQVILNIINNAKDALVENKIADKKIYVNLKELDDKVLISVEDNAGGIPDDILKDIFNPYFSTKDSKNGTGLGLYMSKLIIEEHMGGELSASNANEGARFTLVLNKE